MLPSRPRTATSNILLYIPMEKSNITWIVGLTGDYCAGGFFVPIIPHVPGTEAIPPD